MEDDSECDEPPPLEKLADSLVNVKGANHAVTVKVNEYDNSVSILFLFERFRQIKGYGGHEAFRIYDPEKAVSERHVADNKTFIGGSMNHPDCHRQMKMFLKSSGYQHFHNPHGDYTSKRFHDYIRENKIGIYSTKVL